MSSSEVELNPGDGGSRILTDQTADGRHAQVVKLASGNVGYSDLISMNNPLPVAFGTTYTVDAFNRVRSSHPFTLFDSKQSVDGQPFMWSDQQLSGSGTNSTYNTNQASTTLSVANTTAGVRVRQTKRRFNYQPGKSHLVLLTGIFGTGASGIIKRIGLFDENNGFFFELNGTTLRFVVRSNVTGSPVDTVYERSTWTTKFDGTDAQAMTLDLTKLQLMFIDFAWLGAGRIRFGFFDGGIPIPAGAIDHANIFSSVYISNPNLPVRYEIRNSGSGPASTLVSVCSSVMSEGGQQTSGWTLSADRGATAFTTGANTSVYPIVSMRLRSTHLSAHAQIVHLSTFCTSDNPYLWMLLLNPTTSGTALSFTGVANSAVEISADTTNATTISSLGTVLASGYTNKGGTIKLLELLNDNAIVLGATALGVVDTVVLAIQPLSGSAEVLRGSLGWFETT